MEEANPFIMLKIAFVTVFEGLLQVLVLATLITLCNQPIFGAEQALVFVSEMPTTEEESKQTEDIEPVIGIDFGFPYSRVGIYHNGTVKLVTDIKQRTTLPSMVVFTETNEILAGYEAKKYKDKQPQRTIYGIKDLIGREWNDPIVQQAVQRVPYKIVERDNLPHVQINVGGEMKTHSITQVAAFIFTKLKLLAEDFIGLNVTKAVVSIPAHYSNQQRLATREAGLLAGLKVTRLTNEPTAAILGYDLHNDSVEQNILVYQFGVSTLDVALVTVESGVFEVHETVSKDLIRPITQLLVDKFHDRTGEDLDSISVQRLDSEVERVLYYHNNSLDNQDEIFIHIESIHNNHHLSEQLSKIELDHIVMDILQRETKHLCRSMHNESSYIEKAQVDIVILVGGAQYAPFILQTVQEASCADSDLVIGVGRDEAVAFGATTQAIMAEQAVEMCGPHLEVAPSSISIKTLEGSMHTLLAKQTTLPDRRSYLFTTAVDNQTTVNVQIYKGESSTVKDNHYLGQFNLSGLAPNPQGLPRVGVSIQAEVNGQFNVRAKEMSTGISRSIAFSWEWDDYKHIYSSSP